MNKKVLLGTTALVAAGFAVQDARAADPISLSLGGYQYWGAFAADYDADNLGDASIKYDGEIHFKGKTVLDNGLEVGVRLELEGEQDRPAGDKQDQMDETYTYVSGSFGEIRVGNDDVIPAMMGTAAPYVDYIFGANSPYFSPSGIYMSTFPNMGDQAQFMYFTPVFNGLQVGVAYAPETDTEARQGFYGKGEPYQVAADNGNTTSVAIRFDGGFGEGVGVAAAAGYVKEGREGADDPVDGDAWNVGLSLSMGSFAVGGSYMVSEDTGVYDVGFKGTTYDLGVTYSDGPMSVGISWMHGEQEGTGNGETTYGEEEADSYRFQMSYDMGAGVSVGATLGQDDAGDSGAFFGSSGETTFGAAALLVNF